MSVSSRRLLPAALSLAAGVALAPAGVSAATVLHPPVTRIASTVPANGDLNPYGIALIPSSVGRLHAGNILVDNFNASSNFQGTGTTLLQITPDGHRSLFATVAPSHLPPRCSLGVGLDTGLEVLRSGWVIVGSLWTSNGSASTSQPGCIFILDAWGSVRSILSGSDIAGPWDMAVWDGGSTATLFVTNVLQGGVVAANGDVVHHGTVLRIRLSIPDGAKQTPQVTGRDVIASGFGERTDPSALVIGPTGLALGQDGTLYVADTLANRIAAIPLALTRTTSADTGATVTRGGALNTPLGMAIDGDGNIVTVNGGNGNAVETAPTGRQVKVAEIDRSGTPGGAGTLFGITFVPGTDTMYFVNDGNNTVNRVQF